MFDTCYTNNESDLFLDNAVCETGSLPARMEDREGWLRSAGGHCPANQERRDCAVVICHYDGTQVSGDFDWHRGVTIITCHTEKSVRAIRKLHPRWEKNRRFWYAWDNMIEDLREIDARLCGR